MNCASISSMEPLLLGLLLALITFLYMSGWFALAARLKRIDIIDSAWGLGFVVTAWSALLLTQNYRLVPLMSAIFVSLWGLRLFLYIFSRNKGKTEDRRYVAYREKWGDRFMVNAYFRIFLVQGLLMLLISLASLGSIAATGDFQPEIAALGFTLWAVGIAFETVADAQLRRFLKNPKRVKGSIMTSGVWKYSRHPNYFGEATAWWGAALVAVAAGNYWAVLGAALITLLVAKISGIPLLEARYKDNKAFQAYARKTSIFFPLPPKRR